jgi:Glycosyltransferase family 87
MGYQVPVSAYPLIQDPPFVLWLVLLGSAIGYRLLRTLGVPLGQISAVERGVFSAAVGLGLLQYLPFGLGMSHMLRPQSVWIGMVVLSALFVRDMFRIVRGTWAAVNRRAISRPDTWILICASILLVLLFTVFFQALCPELGIDGLVYHLNGPKRWLQSGYLGYLPTIIQTNWSMGADMLYTIALAIWSDTAAKLIHYAMGLLALMAIFALGRRLRSEAVGFTAACAFFILPRLGSIYLFPIANIDLAITLQVVCAVLAWLEWRRTQAQSWLWCAAICAGLGASYKLTGAIVIVGLCGLILFELRQKHAEWSHTVRLVIPFLALSLLLPLPWLWRSWLLTGAPVYSLFSEVFPTRDWGPEIGKVMTSYLRYYAWDDEHYGLSLTFAQRKAMVATAIILVIAVAATLLWRWRDSGARVLIVIASLLGLFVIWSVGLYSRHLQPSLALTYVLLCMILAKALKRYRWVHALIILVVLLKTVRYVRNDTYPDYPSLPVAVEVATGRMARSEYLTRFVPITQLYEFLNARLPDDGPVLVAGMFPAWGMHGGYGAFYSDRFCYVTDAYFQYRVRMDAWEHFVSDIKREKIAYVVVPTENHRNRVGPEYLPARNEFPFARQLVESYGRRIFSAGGLELYQIQDIYESNLNSPS